MKRGIASFTLGLALLTVPIDEGRAQTSDAYLRIDGVPGESGIIGRAGWIDLNSWSLGHGVAPASGAPGFQPLHLTKRLDRTSPTLAAAAATGARIKFAVLELMRQGASEPFVYYRVVLHDVSLRSYVTGTGGPQNPVESVDLGYARIEWSYWPTPGGTPVTMKFDLTRGVLY